MSVIYCEQCDDWWPEHDASDQEGVCIHCAEGPPDEGDDSEGFDSDLDDDFEDPFGENW